MGMEKTALNQEIHVTINTVVKPDSSICFPRSWGNQAIMNSVSICVAIGREYQIRQVAPSGSRKNHEQTRPTKNRSETQSSAQGIYSPNCLQQRLSLTMRSWLIRGSCIAVGLSLWVNSSALGEGPLAATKLFPDKTLAFFEIEDVEKMKADFSQSSYGKLSQDEQLKPIVDEFYRSLIQMTEELFGQTGLNLDELISIPTGQMAVALLPPPRPSRRSARLNTAEAEASEIPPPSAAMALLIDAGENISGINVVLKRMNESIGNQSEHLQKNLDRLTLHSYVNREEPERQFAYFVDRGAMVAVTNAAYIEDLASVWLGQAGPRKTLSENPRFNSAMSRCSGRGGEKPQVKFFLDPLGLLRATTADNPGSSMMMALLPPLGLDGFEAIAGSLTLSAADFDSVLQIHVQLASPRQAVLSLLRPQSGSTTPEDWVPSDAASYSTINWDLQSTVTAVEQLYNQFRGPDALNQEVFMPAGQRMGLDMRRDILDSLAGRVTQVRGFVRPITADSRSNVLAVKFKNMKRFEKEIFPKILDAVGSQAQMQSENYGRLRAFVFPISNRPNSNNGQAQSAGRPPETCFSIVDDYLLISDSRYMLQQIAGALGDSSNRLNQSLEFQLIRDRIKFELRGKEACAITFDRPEESLQIFYELIRDPDSRQGLELMAGPNRRPRAAAAAQEMELRGEIARSNPMFSALNLALEKHELPPFSVISKYMAPRGGYLVEDETGLHYTAFTMRRE